AAKRRRNLGPQLNEQTITLGNGLEGELRKAEETWRDEGKVRRLWQKDSKLWTGHDESKWLDWLDIVDVELGGLDPLASFTQEIRAEKLRDAVLLGMGGSSLGPEVLAQSLGPAAGFPTLRVLDSTDPSQIRALESAIDLERTLFLVSSKSGTTLEP